ncbi:patatin-like phospholipase family protein [Marinomonas algarum]|uniref:Patatin-like phospholipase family protein n=1 Tax=Marinomonas algarum TaxID=2883105 RepID=A0A9X1LEQ2_9GAMM|nr:patatin-like phospholipase family protein [Marinomonas algarum]MCB5161846.1 patatin-like phospholipase family protein [Marinomonas algarum]
MKKTVALVLGSGAARGHAHIGVIQALEERGYDIISVSGCSIGAIIGGLFAAGKLSEYRQWAESLDRMSVVRLLDMSLLNGGYVKGDRFFEKIQSMIGEPTIESLPIAYTAVGADLLNQKEFWFQRGDLISAMRASSAIPSLISPVALNGRMYVDGGVLNPLPIIPSVPAGADYIVAVDLNGPAQIANVDLPEEDSEAPAWWQSAKGFFMKEDKDALAEKVEYSPESWGRLQTINMMFETMQESLTQYKLAGYPPDLLISVPKNISGFYEFWRTKELIEFGYDVALKAIDGLESPSAAYYSFPKGHQK